MKKKKLNGFRNFWYWFLRDNWMFFSMDFGFAIHFQPFNFRNKNN